MLGLLWASIAHWGRPSRLIQPRASTYEKVQIADFNRAIDYPVVSEQAIASATADYRPIADWSGRLILPQIEAYEQAASDWVWLEVQNAPQSDLIGQRVKLTWQQSPTIQHYLKAVTVDIAMGTAAAQSRLKGDVVPNRLNGRRQVGPLQSLAGAHPIDDVLVRLSQVNLQEVGSQVQLTISSPPVQISGRLIALVDVVESVTRLPSINDCDADFSCPKEYFRVRHYNPLTQRFDGTETIVRIPQSPQDRNGRLMSTVQNLENSPAGSSGWYLYGAFDTQGIFTAQAIQPRSLMQLQADEVVTGIAPSLNFITWQNWRSLKEKQGTLDRTLVIAKTSQHAHGSSDRDVIEDTTIFSEQQLEANWQVGDRGLLIHLFGGIGGELAEGGIPGTVTGHFSFGIAEVVRDRFTGEPRFQITYHQIYGHNPNGIISGPIDWSAYMGDLEKGWLGSRPISDVIVKLDAFAPFELGDQVLSPLDALLYEIRVIAARYRTGDGTGVAPVTPATSCVQDSNQALYIAIEKLEQQVFETSETSDWLDARVNSPVAEHFRALVDLGKDLENLLVPYGVVRSDWKQNAQALAGVNRRNRFVSSQNFVNVLLSWRSMMPRRAHDDLSQIFLQQGAQLWFLRTNQVGGENPDIAPLAPTELLGRWPVFGTLLKRLSDAVSTPMTARVWWIFCGALLGYAAIALLYGVKSRFLTLSSIGVRGWLHPSWLLRLFVMPAVIEEILFRVFLLPHPLEGVTPFRWMLWSALSLLLFLMYHPVNALLFYPPGRPLFWDRRFLTLALLLGLTCTVVYGLTGAFWAIVLIHWLVVVVWLKGLGGNQLLYGKSH